MSSVRDGVITPELAGYIHDHLNPAPDPVSASLRERTVERFGGMAAMNIGEDQGRFLQFLIEVTGARHVVEVGTFTGMSALWMARGLPEGGHLTCLELSEEPIELARAAWEEAGVADRIEVRIGPAIDSIGDLPDGIDLAFVDADKESYAAYVDALLPKLSADGLLAIDNTLWSGSVLDDPSTHDSSTAAIVALNADLAARDDVSAVILSIGDGVTIVRRR